MKHHKIYYRRNSKIYSLGLFLVFVSLSAAVNIVPIKNACGEEPMMMGQTNAVTVSEGPTELHSLDDTNTLLVVQDSNNGYAIRAVNDGLSVSRNTGNAIHAWAGPTAGHGLYGEATRSVSAGIRGSGMNGAPGAEFEVGSVGASNGRGALNLVPQTVSSSPSCMSGDLAVSTSGDLYYCYGSTMYGSWKKIYVY